MADNSCLIREGLRSIIADVSEFQLIGEAMKAEDLSEKLAIVCPDVLVIDYSSQYFSVDDIQVIHEEYPQLNILAITNPQTKSIISTAVNYGITSHLLKDCNKDEIIEAIHSTAKGQKFFCGKIVDTMFKANDTTSSCEGIKLSSREGEIIQLVAEGLSNKEIAKKLFLSVHTISTHRKNIMSKLDVKNTAGLVMYAIRQNIIKTDKILFTSN